MPPRGHHLLVEELEELEELEAQVQEELEELAGVAEGLVPLVGCRLPAEWNLNYTGLT